MARPLIDEGVLCSGLIRCYGGRLRPKDFRRRAREISDRCFPEEASKPTNYFGTIYRYEAGKSKTVVGFLTRKEKLFGEYGEPTHVTHVRYFQRRGKTFVTYRDLTEKDLVFLKAVLGKLCLLVTADYQPNS